MRLIIDMGPRQVYWELPDETGMLLLQTYIQTLGPADGDLKLN